MRLKWPGLGVQIGRLLEDRPACHPHTAAPLPISAPVSMSAGVKSEMPV
jgi:hypothetical protein